MNNLIRNRRFKNILMTFGLWIMFTAVCLIIRALDLQTENMVLVYLLGSVVTAILTDGYFYGIAFSLIGMITLNFYFMTPAFTFGRLNFHHTVQFLLMFVISVIVSYLTSRSKENALMARRKEKETKHLYEITRKLSSAVSIEEILDISLKFFGQVMNLPCALLLSEPDGTLMETYTYINTDGSTEERVVHLHRDILNSDPKSEKGYLIGNIYYEWPLKGKEILFGFMGFNPDEIDRLDENELGLIGQIVESITMAMDRTYFMDKEEQIRQENNEEKYKSNLLRSVSHDIRTPLAGIMGTSELLMEHVKDNPQAYEEARVIYKESSWLYSLVKNILSLTRLQNGKLRITKEIEVVEDIIQASMESIHIRYPNQILIFHAPEEIITAPMDAKLIQQTLINLIDNAHKHSSEEKPIELILTDNGDHSVSVSVKDRGTGIKQEDFPNLFHTFYTTHAKEPDSVRGFGLGLPISEAIMKAHQGSISARNNEDGPGACFTISLPTGPNAMQ